MSRASLLPGHRFFLGALVAAFALGSVGCQAAYTSIRKTGDNEYLLTRTKAGFFTVYGTLYACKASADGGSLTCSEVAEP
jgi:hypothetical protein